MFPLQKLHILPSDFAKMDIEERAFIIGSIQKRIEAENKAVKKAGE